MIGGFHYRRAPLSAARDTAVLAPDILSLGQLNRATLARQLLLERSGLDPVAAVERVAGLQAQMPASPYIGLWKPAVGLPAHRAHEGDRRPASREGHPHAGDTASRFGG
jgi:hypothetical protein